MLCEIRFSLASVMTTLTLANSWITQFTLRRVPVDPPQGLPGAAVQLRAELKRWLPLQGSCSRKRPDVCRGARRSTFGLGPERDRILTAARGSSRGLERPHPATEQATPGLTPGSGEFPPGALHQRGYHDAMPVLRFEDVIAAQAHVDDPDVVEKARNDMALRVALEASRHPNWWGTTAGPSLLEAARTEGLPLAWVPSADIIRLLVESSSPGDRRAVLIKYREETLETCRSLLDECTHDCIATDVALARRAVSAIRGGFHEAGMALAVSMGEPLAAWASTPRIATFNSGAERTAWEAKRKKSKYHWAQIEIDRAKSDLSSGSQFRYQVLIAPIPRFFTPWQPDSGRPRPSHLSRHVVAHQAALDHFTPLNALLAVMLVVGILREQQEWAEEVDSYDS